MNKYEIIYENKRLHGIQFAGHIIYRFDRVVKHRGQPERYRIEVEDQIKQAEFMVEKLNNAHP